MSARDRNFGIAMRERDRRIAGLLDDPYDTSGVTAASDTAGNAFWGSLRELGQRANAAGMGFRADLGDIGRDAGGSAGLYGGLNPLERNALKDRMRQQVFDTGVEQAKAEKATQDAFTGARQDQLIGDLKQADDERAVNEAFADPNATRESVLQRLPPALRPVYQAQWAKQDTERMKAEAEMTKSQRDDSPLVAVMGPDGRSVLVPRGQAVGMRPASSREQGRPVTSGDASDLADFDTSRDELAAVRAAISPEDSTGIVAQIGAKLPYITQLTGWGTDAKKRQAVIDRVKQVIGKTLEGGVLRKEDEAKYEKILPTIGDAPAVAMEKLNGLETAIEKRKGRRLDSLQDAGYEVGHYRQRDAEKGTQPPAGGGGNAKDPLGIR